MTDFIIFLIQVCYIKPACQKYEKQLVCVLLYLPCTAQHRLGVKWSQCTARTAELLNGFRDQAAAALSLCPLPSTLAGLTWLSLSWTGLRLVLLLAQSACTHLYYDCWLEKHSQMSWISDGFKKHHWLGLRLLFSSFQWGLFCWC